MTAVGRYLTHRGGHIDECADRWRTQTYDQIEHDHHAEMHRIHADRRHQRQEHRYQNDQRRQRIEKHADREKQQVQYQQKHPGLRIERLDGGGKLVADALVGDDPGED